MLDQRLEHESFEDNQTIIKYFESLIDGFNNQRLRFATDKEEIILCPNNLLRFKIKAKKKGAKNKLEIHLFWRDNDDDEDIQQDKIQISTE